MQTVVQPRYEALRDSVLNRSWWTFALGWAGLLAPTAVRFGQTVWQSSEQSFGPFVLAIALYLFWTKRADLNQAQRPRFGAPGWFLMGLGLLLYVFGVWSKIAVIEGFSHLPIVAGALWLIGGAPLVARLWFPLVYLLLLVPVPSYLMAEWTHILKQFVSEFSEWLLYAFGFPVARTGVVLTIGAYQLLVADACSGMNSILSLTAVGLFYIYLVRPPLRWQVVSLVAAIVPIAVLANVARVLTLVLVTFYFGDEAGQGFLHEFAGLLMLVVAVFVLHGFDIGNRWLTGVISGASRA